MPSMMRILHDTLHTNTVFLIIFISFSLSATEFSACRGCCITSGIRHYCVFTSSKTYGSGWHVHESRVAFCFFVASIICLLLASSYWLIVIAITSFQADGYVRIGLHRWTVFSMRRAWGYLALLYYY